MKNARESDFFRRLEETWLPVLEKDRFDTSRRWQFARLRDPFIDVVSAQVKDDHSACAINLGVHLTFLPSPSGQRVSPATIEEADCEVRGRLTPTDGLADYWWSFGRDTAATVHSLVTTYEKRGRDVFARYAALPGPFAALTPADISRGTFSAILPNATRVRAALLGARVYRHLGDRERAREFARVGLEFAGMAVGPKKALREILEESA